MAKFKIPTCNICGKDTPGKRVHSSLVQGSAHEECAAEFMQLIDDNREPGESFFNAHHRIMKELGIWVG